MIKVSLCCTHISDEEIFDLSSISTLMSSLSTLDYGYNKMQESVLLRGGCIVLVAIDIICGYISAFCMRMHAVFNSTRWSRHLYSVKSCFAHPIKSLSSFLLSIQAYYIFIIVSTCGLQSVKLKVECVHTCMHQCNN